MNRLLRGQEGAEAIEFAILAPIVATALLMVVEGAVLFGTWLSLNHATREAARFGIAGANVDASNPPDSVALASAVYAHAESLVQGLVGVSLARCSGGGASNCIDVAVQTDDVSGYPTQVEVTSHYTAATITPIIQGLVPAVSLRAEADMRAE